MYIYVCVQLFNLIWFITKFLDGNFILRKLKLKKKKKLIIGHSLHLVYYIPLVT